jgi:glutamine amidotransferase
VFALNFVLITVREMWAFRYPDTHQLHLLERAAGGPRGDRHLEHASPWGTVRVHSSELARAAAVVVASERMDDDPAWRALRPGELLHVDSGLHATVSQVLDRPPAHLLTLADLDPKAAASQAAQKRS